MKTIVEFILAFSTGASFCFALGMDTDTLKISIAGLGASLFNRYTGRYSCELSVWLLIFLLGILEDFHMVTAVSAGPVAVLIIRLFQHGISLFGFSFRFPRLTGERWTAVILAGGWFFLGVISKMDAMLLIGTKPFVVDLAGFLNPFSILLPVSVMLLLPAPRTPESTPPTETGILDFSDLSKVWLNNPLTEESLYDNAEKEPIENKCSPGVDFDPTGPNSTYLKAFWNEYVNPNRKIFEEFDLFGTITSILVILDRHGGVPSVRRQDKKDRLRGTSKNH